jgi:hypothetical protein
VCLPMNPARDFDLTIDMIGRAKAIDPNLQVSVWFYTPYPGTELYELARQRGFVPPQRLEDWGKHTLRGFRAPWAPKGCGRRLEHFTEFYFRMMADLGGSDIRHPAVRVMRSLGKKVLFDVAWLRFRIKFYRLPLEAMLFLRLQELRRRARVRRAVAATRLVPR